jgi:hypothetical protein
MERDSRWKMLELKKPQHKILVGKAARRRLSAEVYKAIRQLRDYGSYLQNPENSAFVRNKLGHSLRRPKLGVLIGRLRKAEVQDLEEQQVYESDVEITTYDEILEQQSALVVCGG